MKPTQRDQRIVHELCDKLGIPTQNRGAVPLIVSEARVRGYDVCVAEKGSDGNPLRHSTTEHWIKGDDRSDITFEGQKGVIRIRASAGPIGLWDLIHELGHAIIGYRPGLEKTLPHEALAWSCGWSWITAPATHPNLSTQRSNYLAHANSCMQTYRTLVTHHSDEEHRFEVCWKEETSVPSFLDEGLDVPSRAQRVYFVTSLDAIDDHYGATFEEIAPRTWQPIALSANHDAFRKKGITPVLFELLVHQTMATLRSSPVSENGFSSGVYRTCDAEHVWQGLHKRGRARYDDDNHWWTYIPKSHLDNEIPLNIELAPDLPI